MSTYGEEWRERARRGEQLDKDEEWRWAEEKAWEAANPDTVATLDEYVGKTVVTIRPLERIQGDDLPARTYMFVRARFRDRLLAEEGSKRYLISPDWVRVAQVSPRKEAPRAAGSHRERSQGLGPARVGGGG